MFNDINRNGVQDKGEEGVKEITIRLEDGSTVKTDEKGYYQFSRVEVGGHFVTLDVRRIPADYSIISPEKVKDRGQIEGDGAGELPTDCRWQN